MYFPFDLVQYLPIALVKLPAGRWFVVQVFYLEVRDDAFRSGGFDEGFFFWRKIERYRRNKRPLGEPVVRQHAQDFLEALAFGTTVQSFFKGEGEVLFLVAVQGPDKIAKLRLFKH